MDLTITTERIDGVAVIALAGEVDIHTAPRLSKSITAALGDGAYDLVIDLGGVEFMDSSGLHTLVGALKKVRAYDGSLRLVDVPERVMKILRMTHLTKVFDIGHRRGASNRDDGSARRKIG